MWRTWICCLVFVAAFSGFALAAEPPLTVAEQREVLQALQELEAARVLIVDLRAVVAKDKQTIGALQGQVEALKQETLAKDKVLAADKVEKDLLNQAVGKYLAIASAADTRADVNLKRAERAERWVWRAAIGGFVVGFIAGAGVVAVAW